VDNAIKDRVSKGWILDEVVPVIYGELTGDQGGPESVPIVDDLQQISALFGTDLAHPPIVKEKEIGFSDGSEELSITAVSFGDEEILKESGDSQVKGGEAFSACLVCECAGEEGFSCSCGSGDNEIMVLFDPTAGLELCHKGTVKASWVTVIDIFDRGALAQFGLPEAGFEVAVLPLGDLPIGHEAQALLEGKGVDVGHLHLLLQGHYHAGQS